MLVCGSEVFEYRGWLGCGREREWLKLILKGGGFFCGWAAENELLIVQNSI